MKKTFWVVALLIILGAIWFATKNGTNDVTQTSIKIGGNYALSCFGAGWAENQLKGAMLAVKEINMAGGVLDKQLEFIAEDNHSEAKGSVSAANKLISVDKVKFMLTGWSDQTEPVIPIIDQNKIVTITTSAGASDLAKKSEYLFATWPVDRIAVKSLADYSSMKGFGRVAIANSIGPWENSLAESFKEFAGKKGFQVLLHVSFQLDTVDFKTQIAQLKEQKIDAVFIPMTDATVDRFLKQAGELGLNATMLYPVDAISVGIDEQPAAYIKNLVYAIYAPSKEKFVMAFRKEYGIDPGASADTAYDAVYMIAQAIEKAGTTETDKVINSFTPFDGASGKTVFDQYGDRSDAEVILMGFDGVTRVPQKIR